MSDEDNSIVAAAGGEVCATCGNWTRRDIARGVAGLAFAASLIYVGYKYGFEGGLQEGAAEERVWNPTGSCQKVGGGVQCNEVLVKVEGKTCVLRVWVDGAKATVKPVEPKTSAVVEVDPPDRQALASMDCLAGLDAQ